MPGSEASQLVALGGVFVLCLIGFLYAWFSILSKPKRQR